MPVAPQSHDKRPITTRGQSGMSASSSTSTSNDSPSGKRGLFSKVRAAFSSSAGPSASATGPAVYAGGVASMASRSSRTRDNPFRTHHPLLSVSLGPSEISNALARQTTLATATSSSSSGSSFGGRISPRSDLQLVNTISATSSLSTSSSSASEQPTTPEAEQYASRLISSSSPARSQAGSNSQTTTPSSSCPDPPLPTFAFSKHNFTQFPESPPASAPPTFQIDPLHPRADQNKHTPPSSRQSSAQSSPVSRIQRKFTKSIASLPSWGTSSGRKSSESSRSGKQRSVTSTTPIIPSMPFKGLRVPDLSDSPGRKGRTQHKARKDSSDSSLAVTSKKVFSRSFDDLASFGFHRNNLVAPPLTASKSEPGAEYRVPLQNADNTEILHEAQSVSPEIGAKKARRMTQGSLTNASKIIPKTAISPAIVLSDSSRGLDLTAPCLPPKQAALLSDAPNLVRQHTSNSIVPARTVRPASSATLQPGSRDSLTALHEGLLQLRMEAKNIDRRKKAQSRAFTFFTSSGTSPTVPNLPNSLIKSNALMKYRWQPTCAILRGTKLSLYKLPDNLHIASQALFPNTVTGASASPDVVFKTLLDEARQVSLKNASHSLIAPLIGKAEVGIVSDDPLVPFYLRLFTDDGASYDLQCTSEAEMYTWKSQLTAAGKCISVNRASYIAPIVDASSLQAEKPKRRPLSVVEANTFSFGVDLETLIKRDNRDVPLIAERLLSAVEKYGLFEPGIYRVSGEIRLREACKAAINANRKLDPCNDPIFNDPHVLASVTKLWFRELPYFIPSPMYQAFMDTSLIQDIDERLYAVRNLVWSLPAPAFNLLKLLMRHLNKIAEHELDNNMSPQNLSIVWVPNIFCPAPGPARDITILNNSGFAGKLFLSLIMQHEWIFSYADEEDQEVTTATASSPEPTQNPLV